MAPTNLHKIKTDAIDQAVKLKSPASFADLGGVWAVDGGYTFYARGCPGVSAGTLVDELTDTLSDEAKQRAAAEGIRLIKGNFGSREIADQLGEVDAILLFDVLLHQVRPDWDELLATYASRTRMFIIVHPELRGEQSVRLVELGRDEYLRLVPNEPQAVTLFDKLDEPHRGRTWRDAFDVWQWGITERDLRAAAEGLGFEEIYHHNAGPWLGNSHFDNAAYIFARP
jgi:hypothetical protein